MNVYYLRAATESDLKEALTAADLAPFNDVWGDYTTVDGVTVSYIGQRGTVSYDEDGTPIITLKSGFLANILADALPSPLRPFVVTPATPYRVFAD